MLLVSGVGGADWRHYLARHPLQVKKRVRKGIPDALRGMAWQVLSGGRDLLLQNEGEKFEIPAFLQTQPDFGAQEACE